MSSFLTAAPNASSSPSLQRKNFRIHDKHKPIAFIPTCCKYHLQNPRLQQISSILCNFFNPSLPPSLDPKHVLSNNYAPVGELPPTECLEIEGNLPLCLNGAYLRNGPNTQYPPQGPYHLFDGDGMIHCLRISNGHATLCSRYVKTYKYLVEHAAGLPVFPYILSGLISGLGTMFARAAVYAAILLYGKYDPVSNGVGPANTSLAYIWGKLFSLGESDLPYQIRITPNGDIETIGRYDFHRKYPSLPNMTAHPKSDPETGETFAYRCSPISPFLTYFRFDSGGSKQPDVPIYSLKNPTWIHDFAITRNYAIFADMQIGIATNVFKIIAGCQPLVGADPNKVSRIGVIPRYASDESEMRWFNLPGFNIIHALNAWEEEEDSIVVIAPNITPVGYTLEKMSLAHATVEKVRINLRSGTVTRSIMSTKNLELGVINPAFTGRKNRYGYLAVGNPFPDVSGVVKLDWSLKEGREVGCRMFEKGCFGAEPFYVPKRNHQTSTQEEEDDGYLVMYVHNENTGESKFLVMDAKSPTLDTVAAVKLPARVPYGFHGLFVRESDLLNL